MSSLYEKYPHMFGRSAQVDHPQGWDDIVNRLTDDINALGKDVIIYQTKEKFGGLRYYTSHDGDDDVDSLVQKAEQEAGRTCQNCGKSDETVTTGTLAGGYWITTRCTQCSQEDSENGQSEN